MKFSKKLLSMVLLMTMCLCIAPQSVFNLDASAANEEYALFPLNEMYLVRTNTKLDADQKKEAAPDGGHVRYAFDFSGNDTKVKAPFTGKVLFVDKGNEHAVFFQSLNKVKLANGKTDYLTCVFVHDDNVSNVTVGKVYKQGEYICDQGTFGKGVKGKYKRHLHLEIAVGKLDISTKYSVWNNLAKVRDSKNGIHVHEALFLKSNVKRNKDYIKVACQNNRIIKLNWKTVSLINFNTNGGSVSYSGQYFEVDKNYGSLPAPSRSGYIFDGWYTAQNGGSRVANETKVTKGDKTLYAHWRATDPNKLYTIEFNGNGGSGYVNSMQVVAGEKVILNANNFCKPGYAFKGWVVKRKSDGKWRAVGKGWQTEKTINSRKYTKKIFVDKGTYVIDSYWTDGTAKRDTFIMVAIFEKCSSHKWDSGKVTTAPTTVKKGVKTFTCTNCKTSRTETIARSNTEKYFSNVYIKNIKTNDARIGGKTAKTVYMKGTGFYFGTSPDSLVRYTKNLKGKADAPGNFNEIFYNLSGWHGKLKPRTTYYFSVFYIDKNGNECASVIKSFRTK